MVVGLVVFGFRGPEFSQTPAPVCEMVGRCEIQQDSQIIDVYVQG